MVVDPPEQQQGSRQVLENDLRKTQRQAFGQGMVHNLLSQWRAFYAFCCIYEIYVGPVTVHVLCLIAQFLAYNLRSPDSIVNYLMGVRTLHLLTNFPPPDMKDFEVKITVRGLRRTLKHAVKQASPITPLILAQIHAVLNMRRKGDVVFWTSLLLGFFLGGLSLHLNHLIASRTANYDWPFGTLPFGLFGSNLDTRDLETYPRTYSGHF